MFKPLLITAMLLLIVSGYVLATHMSTYVKIGGVALDKYSRNIVLAQGWYELVKEDAKYTYILYMGNQYRVPYSSLYRKKKLITNKSSFYADNS